MQSPGAYALVNAMKNNLESKLIEVELTVRLRDMKNKFFLVDKQFYSNPYHIKVEDKRSLHDNNPLKRNLKIIPRIELPKTEVGSSWNFTDWFTRLYWSSSRLWILFGCSLFNGTGARSPCSLLVGHALQFCQSKPLIRDWVRVVVLENLESP